MIVTFRMLVRQTFHHFRFHFSAISDDDPVLRRIQPADGVAHGQPFDDVAEDVRDERVFGRPDGDAELRADQVDVVGGEALHSHGHGSAFHFQVVVIRRVKRKRVTRFGFGFRNDHVTAGFQLRDKATL